MVIDCLATRGCPDEPMMDDSFVLSDLTGTPLDIRRQDMIFSRHSMLKERLSWKLWASTRRP
jgi:hypothetical protein